MRGHCVVVALATAAWLCGCSLVFDGERHMSGAPGAMDAGSGDAGSTVDAGPMGGGPIPPESFCDELTAAFCYAEQHCCPMPRTESQCLLDTDAVCAKQFAGAASDPRTRYSPEQARVVLDEGRTLAEACDGMGAAFWANYRLVDVFEGTVPTDGECETAVVPDDIRLLSCTGDNICRLTGSFWVRHCLPHVAPGGRCYESYDCVPGYYCAGGACVPAQPDGSTCTSGFECESLRCEGATEPRRCVAADATTFCYSG